jgi:hypothetical protein
MGRLVLRVSDGSLNFEGLEGQERLILKAPSISLATILEKRKLKDDDQLKVLLSYLVAKAVWQFYDSHWMAEDWTKKTVHFMQERLSGVAGSQEIFVLIHKPFITAEIRPLGPHSKSLPQKSSSPEDALAQILSGSSHIYPKILALGVMLLEILLGEGIEGHRTAECLDQNGQPLKNADHVTAGYLLSPLLWKKLKKTKNSSNVKELLKEAINICVRPDRDKLGTDPEQVRMKLYTHVVAPLRQLFRESWPNLKDPEDFDPDPVEMKSSDFIPDNGDAEPTSTMLGNGALDGAYSQHPPANLDQVQLPVAAVESQSIEDDADIFWGDDGQLQGEDDDEDTTEAR